jgi:hypothetical protein
MELGTLAVTIKSEGAAATSHTDGVYTRLDTYPLAKAMSSFTASTGEVVRELARIAQISNDFISTYQPPDLSEITVLPHKKHLVPKHQAAKRREQLKVWGLRR